MKVNKPIATLLLGAGLVVGGLGAGALMAPPPSASLAAPVAQSQPAGTEDDQAQEPSYTGSVPVVSAATDGLSEADEATALQGTAAISAADAEAAALAAHPGSSVRKTELDNENGYLVYSVELDNGKDVKIDAGNGAVLAAEQDEDGAEMDEAAANESEEASAADDTDDIQQEDGDQEDGDQQDEQGGQEDDADEAPGVEDAAGQ